MLAGDDAPLGEILLDPRRLTRRRAAGCSRSRSVPDLKARPTGSVYADGRAARRSRYPPGRGGRGRDRARDPDARGVAATSPRFRSRLDGAGALVGRAEAYVAGVSTRKVGQVVESLGLRISKRGGGPGSASASTTR